jgi:hypothetical protein
MDVVPVNFSTEHKSMLRNCKKLLERDEGLIAKILSCIEIS